MIQLSYRTRRTGARLLLPAVVFTSFASLCLSAPVLTSSAPPSGLFHPIIDLNSEGEYAQLIGASMNGRWIADKNARSRVKGGETYRCYSLMKSEGSATGGKPEVSETGSDAWNLKLINAPKSGGNMIGINGSWNALPRVPHVQSTDLPVYRAAVAAVLKQKGLERAPVHITRIVRIDLDGDGDEEVLISAASPRFDHPGEEGTLTRARAGDYSFVMLRQMLKGRLRTSVLDGEFRRRVTEGAIPNVYEIGNALDADGDGKMELFIRWRYYEGGGVDVYRVKSGKATKVLSAGDGV